MTYESKFVRSSLMKRWTKSIRRGISFYKIKGLKKRSANETELCSSFHSIFSSSYLGNNSGLNQFLRKEILADGQENKYMLYLHK